MDQSLSIHLQPFSTTVKEALKESKVNQTNPTFDPIFLAFRTTKDNIVVFRPDQNAKRMNAGAVDFCMSTVPERIYLEAIEQVVKANSHWVPPVNKYESHIHIQF